MGNVGGIEKVLVGCILVIILAILGIAVSSTNEPTDPPYQKVATKPERTQDPANGAKRKDGASALMGGTQDVDANAESDAQISPRVVHGTAKEENGNSPVKPKDVTDETVPPSPPVNTATDNPAKSGKKVEADPKQAPAPNSGVPKFHVVAKGDTVEKIAVQYYEDRRMAEEILKLNEDLEPTKLMEGHKVLLPEADIKTLLKDDEAAKKGTFVPSGSTPAKKAEEPAPRTTNGKYRVKKGDTILSICRDHYGSVERWQEVLKTNGMKEGKELREGMELTLP